MAESATIILDGVPCKVAKIFQYKALVTESRGFFSDPHFLAFLNEEGNDGWKYRDGEVMGASKFVILLERELAVLDQLPDDGTNTSDAGTVEEVNLGETPVKD